MPPRAPTLQARINKFEQWLEELPPLPDAAPVVPPAEVWASLAPADRVHTKIFPVFGIPFLRKLSHAFYTRVWADTAQWFAKQFRQSNQEEAEYNQWTFFCEHMGGPKTFERWRNVGLDSLVSFTHEKFTMTKAGLKKWLVHMNAALEDVHAKDTIPEEAIEVFLAWCESFGTHMIDPYGLKAKAQADRKAKQQPRAKPTTALAPAEGEDEAVTSFLEEIHRNLPGGVVREGAPAQAQAEAAHPLREKKSKKGHHHHHKHKKAEPAKDTQDAMAGFLDEISSMLPGGVQYRDSSSGDHKA